MALSPDPVSYLRRDGGTLELATDGDAATAAVVLRRVVKRFGCTVTRHVRRQFFDREYWFLDVQGREYMLMRCTLPSTTPGVCLCGPIDGRDSLALYRKVAEQFEATEVDLRSWFGWVRWLLRVLRGRWFPE